MIKDLILNKLKNNGIIINENITINDNYYTITSRIDGSQRVRIYGRYLNRLGITSEEYNILFPDAPLMSRSDIDKTIKNTGKHMKTEKYKIMFSEKIKGTNNPNHRYNTTLEQRKQRSPFCDEFYIKKNISIKNKKKFIKKILKSKEYTTTIQYYLNRGYNENDAKIKLKERQTTFSLNICIKKHGYDKGMVIFNKRQNKWHDSICNNGNIKGGFSKISQDLFNNLLKKYNLVEYNNIYFATKNKEFKLNDINNKIYLYDFVDIKNKKIIEYNGDLYHANPKLFQINDRPHPFNKNITSLDIWNYDRKKSELATKHDFDILVIWDSDYRKNKKYTTKKCIDFLKK